MHIHSLKRAALAACAFAVLAAAPAHAVTTKLRVEADGHDIGPGFHYVHGSVSYTTSRSEACGGSGNNGSISGPSALGLLIQASEFTSDLRPVQISDQFEPDLGPFVCGVGGYEGSADAYWLYKVDHVAPEVGADQFTIDQSIGEVLWYFVNTKTMSNTGKELELVLDKQVVQAGKPVEVTVREYDDNGKASPADGVQLQGAGDVTTDNAGKAKVVFDDASQPFMRGVRANDIPTDRLQLCVWGESASECDKWATGWVVGTHRDDRMRGTDDPERIAGRRGDDRINARGDGKRDVVRCGGGDDIAVVDQLDRVKHSCETVKRR